MLPRIVVFGCGNPSRGDDALGSLLLERVEAWRAERPDLDVRCVADFQLQIEHALDLSDRDLALFVDADASCAPPFVLRRVAPVAGTSHSTHALSPGAVLHVYRTATGETPPPAWVLGVRGDEFELGDPLSPTAAGYLEAAWLEMRAMLQRPDAEAWDARLHAARTTKVALQAP